MENFLGIEYEGKNKLTHKEMIYYLSEKNESIPKAISFDKLNKEKILKGHYLVVIDENKRVIPYLNPKRIENLMPELLAAQRKKDFSERRAKTLKKNLTKKIFPSKYN